MLAVQNIRFFRQNLKTRFPFRYGIASMTEVPQLFVCAEISHKRIHSEGMSADLLPPKWFTKEPTSDYYAHDLPEMMRVIRQAADFATDVGESPSFFAWWRDIYSAQMNWAAEHKIAPLLASFGVSLIERAVLDAVCRATGLTLHQLLHTNCIEIDFRQVRPNLRGIAPCDVIVPQPPRQVLLRHTIGMSDPLTPAEIAAEDRVDDGLPHSLLENIRCYGLRYFKVKLSGICTAGAHFGQLRLARQVEFCYT